MYKPVVCVPIFNCLSFTKDFVASVKSQYELDYIFFDNGSTDGSDEWLQDELPHATIVKCSHNLGISAAFNALMMEAKNREKYTHIIYSNNDVIMRPKTIDNLVWAWSNREDENIVRISGVDVREDDYKSFDDAHNYVFNYDISKPALIYGGAYTLFVWDSEAIEKAGLLNSIVDYYGDNIHAEECIKKGLTGTTFIPAIILHRGSSTIKNNPEHRLKLGRKSELDNKYAHKYFGINSPFNKDMHQITERARAEWAPKLEAITERMCKKWQ